VDLIDADIRVSIELLISITEEQPGANDKSLRISQVFPMQIRQRGFEMRLVIQDNSVPAPLADLTLIRAVARGRRWAGELLTGRVESIAAIAKREGVIPKYVRPLTRLAFLPPQDRRSHRSGPPTDGAHGEGSD
jgi:hypothetical protein